MWRADGYSLGDLLYSLPLAPGQRRRVAVVDWDRRTSSARTESLEFEEELDALLSRDRDITEIVGSDLHEQTSAGSHNTTWGAAGGIGAGFIGSGFGIFGGVAGGGGGSDSESWQRSARQFSADSLQQLRDRVSQRSSAVRDVRSSVVQTVAQGETLRAETEVVANYNRCHAMTVEYFQVLRHFLVTHELADVRECLFVPLPMTQFDRGKALRWREPLTRYLTDRRLRAGFAAIERIADNWVGWDFPAARYSEEAPESLEGELRISFMLPRPRDDEDGQFQVDMWAWLQPLLPTDALELWTARLNDRIARDRDAVFRAEIAPQIAANLVQRLRFAYVMTDGGEVEIPLDATLVSRYAERAPLYVTLNPNGALPPVPREDIAHVKAWYDGGELPADAQVIVHGGRMRYHAPHSTALLFDDPRILDDLRTGDPIVVSTPVSREELRNPREEDLELADRLVAHLNASLEFYHQAIWSSLDAQRRYLLLDAVLVPGLGGHSIASVCANELIGIVGNSLVLPAAPGMRLDPRLAPPDDDIVIDVRPGRPDGDDGEPTGDAAPVDLINAYATSPAPPLRVSVPTRGVYAEAVSGSCNSCEEIDDSRYWRWTTDGMLAPPEIEPVSTDSRAEDEPDLTPTPLPTPLVSIQNAPDVPDPFGLKAAFELISKPELFRDITGLEGTQRNARAAFEGALSAASALGEQAHTLASQQELGRNAGRMLDRIQQAKADGLLTDKTAQDLAASTLKGLIGEPRAAAGATTADETVKGVLDGAAQSDKAEIKVTNPTETVEVSFDETSQPSVGGATVPETFVAPDPFVEQDIVVDAIAAPAAAPGSRAFAVTKLQTYADLTSRVSPATLAALEQAGFVRRNPADTARFQVRSELRIVYPADPKRRSRVAGTGRLPVVVLVHGMFTPVDNAGAPFPNHQGYAYLQDDLAAHGIVSVSVDNNIATIVNSHLDMRAEMVLGALDRLRAFDTDATTRFHKRLDFDRVGLMGHSRGGDAVILAALLNRARTSKRYGIKAVCALSPTDWSGTLAPANVRSLTAADTGFLLVLYPGLDGDLAGDGDSNGKDGARNWEGTGFRHYDRATCQKALVMIDHCAHRPFNRKWRPVEDTMHPDDFVRLLSDDAHERLAKEYIGGLFRLRLLGQKSQRGLFDGTRANTVPASGTVQWSFGQTLKAIDEMQPGAGPAAGTRALIGASITELADVRVGTRALADETIHQTGVLDVAPNVPGPPPNAYTLTVDAAHRDWSSFDRLTFRLAVDADLSSPTAITNSPLPSYTLTVTDTTNKTVVLASTALPAPARPVYHELNTGENCSVIRLQTITVPTTSLTGIDRTRIKTVAITPDVNFPRTMFFDSLQLVRM